MEMKINSYPIQSNIQGNIFVIEEWVAKRLIYLFSSSMVYISVWSVFFTKNLFFFPRRNSTFLTRSRFVTCSLSSGSKSLSSGTCGLWKHQLGSTLRVQMLRSNDNPPAIPNPQMSKYPILKIWQRTCKSFGGAGDPSPRSSSYKENTKQINFLVYNLETLHTNPFSSFWDQSKLTDIGIWLAWLCYLLCL